MNKRTPIVNISGDNPETLLQFAKDLGTSKIRRNIVTTVYGRGTRPRSRKQIMAAANIPDKDKQQVQNQLNYLYSHHLIIRTENDGSVEDGDKYLYGKDDTVRAHIKKIIRYADNPRLAEKTPTKRRPLIQGAVNVRAVTKRALTRKKHLKVLYLAASADDRKPLRVDAEIRAVQASVRGSRFRDNISVEYRPAADLRSLIDGLNDHRPQIVHFSGHGNEAAIATDTGDVAYPAQKSLPFELLARALAATDSPPDVVVLSSCKSSGAKKVLLPPAKILISMRESISDIAANAFAVQFYAAIASGQSVKAAFDQGSVAVEAVSISEFDTPELLSASGISPATMILT